MIKRTIRKKNQLTMPHQVLEALGLTGEGDEVGFMIAIDGGVTLQALATTIAARPDSRRSTPNPTTDANGAEMGS